MYPHAGTALAINGVVRNRCMTIGNSSRNGSLPRSLQIFFSRSCVPHWKVVNDACQKTGPAVGPKLSNNLSKEETHENHSPRDHPTNVIGGFRDAALRAEPKCGDSHRRRHTGWGVLRERHAQEP